MEIQLLPLGIFFFKFYFWYNVIQHFSLEIFESLCDYPGTFYHPASASECLALYLFACFGFFSPSWP